MNEEKVNLHPQDEDQNRTFEKYVEKKPSSLFVRFIITNRHLVGLALGGGFAYLRHRKTLGKGFSFKSLFLRIFLLLHWPFMKKKLLKQPFGVQLRRRLEMLGATYIKLGQIMSLREDMLPKDITDELKKLLDTLPAISYDRFVELVEEQLKQPIHRVYSEVKVQTLGSASIAQTHRATLRTGEDVVIKLLKPGTRELIQTDSRIIKFIGSILEIFAPQLQPKNMFAEFCEYTNREVDFRLEADNAKEFAANFAKEPDIVFPKIYSEFCTSDIITMSFLRGLKPDERAYSHFNQEQRERIVDLGSFSIIKMLYDDGFFHADLHPGNLMLIESETGPKCGFIDLGMVGRFEESTRKNMLYYYNSLIMGDPNGAARYLTLVSKMGKGSDPEGFRKEFVHVGNKWLKSPNFKDFSLAQLIFESVVLGSKYRMYFPLELVLMVKAIITFEGVGNIIMPGFDIQKVSKKHIRKMFINEVNPVELLKTSLQNAPEFIDVISRSPLLIMESFRKLEQSLLEKKETKAPVDGLKSIIFAGCCIIGGCILAAAGQPWFVFAPLMGFGGIVALKS